MAVCAPFPLPNEPSPWNQPGWGAGDPFPPVTSFPLPEARGLGVFAASPSAILRKNMLAAGMDEPPGSAAHHMVAWDDKRAAISRAILQQVGIGVNQEVNGVFLPRDKNYPSVGDAQHSIIHSDDYHREVERRLTSVNPLSKTAVEAQLRQMRYEMERGLFPK
jgi:hypothetical protein